MRRQRPPLRCRSQQHGNDTNRFGKLTGGRGAGSRQCVRSLGRDSPGSRRTLLSANLPHLLELLQLANRNPLPPRILAKLHAARAPTPAGSSRDPFGCRPELLFSFSLKIRHKGPAVIRKLAGTRLMAAFSRQRSAKRRIRLACASVRPTPPKRAPASGTQPGRRRLEACPGRGGIAHRKPSWNLAASDIRS